MDATLSESEELLRDSARRLGAALACESVTDLETFDDAVAWKSLAETGLLGLRIPESAGGGGGSTMDEALVVEALAYYTVAAPYLGSAAIVSELLMAAHAPDETLGRLASGELRIALGLTNDLTQPWRESSSTPPVTFDSAGASGALVLVGTDAPTLKVVALSEGALGLDLSRRVHDANPAVQVDVGPLGGEIAPEDLARAMARMMTLVAADLVGVMDAGLVNAVEYAATREQFGVPIATFQAVQHLCADQMVSLEGARSLTEYAAWAVDEVDVDEATRAARSAKAYASRAGRSVTETAVQVHGGMGFTWDCRAHVFLKRALTDAQVLGDYAHQVNQLTAAEKVAS